MTEDPALISDLVEKMNAEAYLILAPLYDEAECLCLVEYHGDGYDQYITFLGQAVWSSETDGRQWEGEGEEQELEPIEAYVRKQANEIVQTVARLKF